jgi:hypothetical protein
MKNEILLRWLLMSEKLRWLSLAGLLTGIALLAGYIWLLPVYRQLHHLQHQVIQQQLRYQQILTPLRQQPALQALQMRNQQLLEEIVREGRPFSLHGLLQHSGGELEQWQPGRQDSQLQLWLEWPQLKALFAYLVACEPAPALTSFIVQRKADRLHATFHLAFDDENSVH